MPTKTVRPAAALLLTTLVAGCDSRQEAQPLSRTVPVAVLLLVALPLCWTGAHLLVRFIGHELSGRLLEPSPELHLQWPRATAAAAAAPLVVTVAIAWPAACWYVATAYRQPTYDFFSWDEMVVVTAVLGLIAVVLGAVSTLSGSALRSGSRRGVIAARWVLAIVIGLSIATGFGLLWIPALAMSFATTDAYQGSTYRPMPSR